MKNAWCVEKKLCEGCLELSEGCFVSEVVCWVLCV